MFSCDSVDEELERVGHVGRMRDEQLAEISCPGSGGEKEAGKTVNAMGGLR